MLHLTKFYLQTAKWFLRVQENGVLRKNHTLRSPHTWKVRKHEFDRNSSPANTPLSGSLSPSSTQTLAPDCMKSLLRRQIEEKDLSNRRRGDGFDQGRESDTRCLWFARSDIDVDEEVEESWSNSFVCWLSQPRFKTIQIRVNLNHLHLNRKSLPEKLVSTVRAYQGTLW